MTRDKRATIVRNCILKLQDTTNSDTRGKEKSGLRFPFVKDLLIAKNSLKSFDFWGTIITIWEFYKAKKGNLLYQGVPPLVTDVTLTISYPVVTA